MVSLSKPNRGGKRKLPDPHAPYALTITDGQERDGSVVRREVES